MTGESSKNVAITIHASVSTSITLENSEALEDAKARFVDIYLHGAGESGHADKTDLGADSFRITSEPSEEMVLVNKGLLLALIDTAQRKTNLEAIFDHTRNTHFDWSTVSDLTDGIDKNEFRMS